MKSVRGVVLPTLAVAAVGGVACLVFLNPQGGRETARESVKSNREIEPLRTSEAVPRAESRVATSATRQRPLSQKDLRPPVAKSQAESVKTDRQAEAKTEKVAGTKQGLQKAAPANQGAPPTRPEIQDPMARVALAFVGADADAEAYWYEAINDPSLSAHERQDLIEDLNEDGLSDPKNPTMDDLPLILSRIDLLEAVVWDAMDEVNLDAFLEAYKDLVNLANLVMGGGEPVR